MRRLLLLLNTGTPVSRALLVSRVPTHTELEPEMRWSNDLSTAFTTLMAIRTAVRGKRHRATEQTKLLVCEIILIDSSKCDVTSSTECVLFFLRDVICWKRRERCSNEKNMLLVALL